MSIKSQLDAMSGKVPAPAAPVSQFARFVQGDIKGGETAHNFRMSMVATAILESFKGNYRNMAEAAALTAGKSKKARAYKAGFEAVGVIAKLAYAGKWDAADNKAVREQAHVLSQKLEFEFEAAFLTVVSAPAEKAPSDKPSAKQRAEAAEAEAAELREKLATSKPLEIIADNAVVDIGQAVEAVTMAVQQGILQADEMLLLRAALAAYDAAADAQGAIPATAALLAATPTLLQAQAH